MIFILMAWRNIWRNRRRSLITISAIAFGLAVLIFFLGMGKGFREQMIENSIRLYTGHIQICAKGYEDNPTIERSILDQEEPLGIIKGLDGIEAISQRVQAPGLISGTENGSGVLVVGIDPLAESKVSMIDERIVAGRYLEFPDDQGILIGKKMAKNLMAKIGDKIVLMVQARDGSIGADAFRVKGIFQTGSPQLDTGLCYISLKRAQELFALDRGISQVALLLKDRKILDSIVEEIKNALPDEEYEVLSWKELSPEVVQFVELNKASFAILKLIVFIIVALGILNTLLMSIFERVREFGVMMAMGTRPAQIVAMVFLESFFLGMLSVGLGSVLGILVSLYFQQHGINLSKWADGVSAMPYLEPILYLRIEVIDLVNSIKTVLLTTLGATIYPAIKAARLRPVEAMRHI